jgi:hypothetical protein
LGALVDNSGAFVDFMDFGVLEDLAAFGSFEDLTDFGDLEDLGASEALVASV